MDVKCVNATKVKELKFGERYHLIIETDRYYKVLTPSGKKNYIKRRFHKIYN